MIEINNEIKTDLLQNKFPKKFFKEFQNNKENIKILLNLLDSLNISYNKIFKTCIKNNFCEEYKINLLEVIKYLLIKNKKIVINNKDILYFYLKYEKKINLTFLKYLIDIKIYEKYISEKEILIILYNRIKENIIDMIQFVNKTTFLINFINFFSIIYILEIKLKEEIFENLLKLDILITSFDFLFAQEIILEEINFFKYIYDINLTFLKENLNNIIKNSELYEITEKNLLSFNYYYYFILFFITSQNVEEINISNLLINIKLFYKKKYLFNLIKENKLELYFSIKLYKILLKNKKYSNNESIIKIKEFLIKNICNTINNINKKDIDELIILSKYIKEKLNLIEELKDLIKNNKNQIKEIVKKKNLKNFQNNFNYIFNKKGKK